MDDGEEIQGLDEDWNFAGAKVGEWIAGCVTFMLAGELSLGFGRSMPLLLVIWFGTTLGLAAIRRGFPDQEKGMRNAFMEFAGFDPPGLPKPYYSQPLWSGAPMRDHKEGQNFKDLDLGAVFKLKLDEKRHREKNGKADDDYDY